MDQYIIYDIFFQSAKMPASGIEKEKEKSFNVSLFTQLLSVTWHAPLVAGRTAPRRIP